MDELSRSKLIKRAATGTERSYGPAPERVAWHRQLPAPPSRASTSGVQSWSSRGTHHLPPSAGVLRSSMASQPLSDVPALPESLAAANEAETASLAATLVRLGDTAGSTPAVRQQLVADGVLLRIAQLLQQRSEWYSQTATHDNGGTDEAGIRVLSQCLRVCGNSCIDCDAARDVLLRGTALPAVLACLRRTDRVEVCKFAAGALANLVCAHEEAQKAFMKQHATNAVVPALNAAIARIRGGQASDDDYVLCKLILRLYINLSACAPDTPPHLIRLRQSHLLSQPLLSSLVAVGRLFVVPVSDQPDADDRTLLSDLVLLCHALPPASVVGSEHSDLISLVIDCCKRQDEALQQLSLDTLCSWARCSPRILPFLSSRLHSSRPNLQRLALLVWLRLTNERCDDAEVLEAALNATPLFLQLAASRSADVADLAVSVLVNVAAQKEAREQMWTAKGFVRQLRLQLTGRASPEAVVRLLRCLSLSPELAGPMRDEGLLDDALQLWHTTQQRTRDVERDTLQLGLYRYLRNLVHVTVQTDGQDREMSNARWESRQWSVLQSKPLETAAATRRDIGRRIAASPAFKHMLDTASVAVAALSPCTVEAARLLAALIVTLAPARRDGEESEEKQQLAGPAEWVAPPAVLQLLALLARGGQYEEQYAAASAICCLVEAHSPLPDISPSDLRELLVHEAQHSGSLHVVSAAVAALEVISARDARWRWHDSERQLLAQLAERWAIRVQRQRAHEDLDDPSDEFTAMCTLCRALQQLLSGDRDDAPPTLPATPAATETSEC